MSRRSTWPEPQPRVDTQPRDTVGDETLSRDADEKVETMLAALRSRRGVEESRCSIRDFTPHADPRRGRRRSSVSVYRLSKRSRSSAGKLPRSAPPQHQTATTRAGRSNLVLETSALLYGNCRAPARRPKEPTPWSAVSIKRMSRRFLHISRCYTADIRPRAHQAVGWRWI